MVEKIECDWCKVKPYYISIHDESKSPKETLLCRDCYEDYESGKIDLEYDTMKDAQAEEEYENDVSALNEQTQMP